LKRQEEGWMVKLRSVDNGEEHIRSQRSIPMRVSNSTPRQTSASLNLPTKMIIFSRDWVMITVFRFVMGSIGYVAQTEETDMWKTKSR
jgi:hypothetical protein